MLIRIAVLVSALAPWARALWPQPNQLFEGNTTLLLSHGFSIRLRGALAHGAPSDFQSAVSRLYHQLRTDQLERLVVGRGAVDAPSFCSANHLRSLTVSLTSSSGSIASIAENAQLPLSQRVETYTLNVPSDGITASLTADTTLGLFRGLTTFSQLWYTWENTIYAINTPVVITDKPAYPYRGFMLDTARNYFPVRDILRQLDAMSYVKANTFHWHIVDAQSFPLVVPAFTELSEKGAYSRSEIYTPSDVQKVISYAGALGIDVLVEIDIPGHTAAIADSHPDFIACNQATPWATYANEPPAGQLRLASPAVLTFITKLFTDVLSVLPSKYFSTGGDEINANCYNQDAETQAELKATGQTFNQSLSNFVQNAHQVVRKAGKTPVVWEEMILNFNVPLGNDTVIMVWISSENAQAVIEKGFQIVYTLSNYFYLDCGAGGWLGDFVAGNSWCDPFHTWQFAYSFNPMQNISDTNKHLVLGGEALLWTEQSGPDNVDSIVWPRAASVAEIFWTGATLPDGTPANTKEALPRLHDLRYRLVQRGIKAINLQPHWCAIRPNACDLTA